MQTPCGGAAAHRGCAGRRHSARSAVAVDSRAAGPSPAAACCAASSSAGSALAGAHALLRREAGPASSRCGALRNAQGTRRCQAQPLAAHPPNSSHVPQLRVRTASSSSAAASADPARVQEPSVALLLAFFAAGNRRCGSGCSMPPALLPAASPLMDYTVLPTVHIHRHPQQTPTWGPIGAPHGTPGPNIFLSKSLSVTSRLCLRRREPQPPRSPVPGRDVAQLVRRGTHL
jgi:hypothetical protein